MSEIKQLALLVAATLVLGIIGLGLVTVIPPLLEGNLVVDSYDAVLYENGTLVEHFTYDVKNSGEYRGLTRYWDVPLMVNESITPYVQFIALENPLNTVGYIKDYRGIIALQQTVPDPSAISVISAHAKLNEIGIYKPTYYDVGMYSATYTYIIHPVVNYDQYHSQLNLALVGDQHIPYRNVNITFPSRSIDKLYIYPASLSVSEVGNTYVITGTVAENEVLAIEAVGNSKAFSGIPAFWTQVDDLKGKTESAAFLYHVPYYTALALNLLAKAAVLLIPMLFIYVYNRYGREKVFTVPAYLSTIPNPALKPWQVNLLFKGDAQDFNEDGYYATLLDLHRRKIIAITEKGEGNGIEIRLLSGATTDPYEQRVLGFIDLVAENGVFDTAGIEALALRAKTNSSAEEKALKYQRTLTDVTSRVDTTLVSRYIVDGRDHIVPLLLTTIVLFAVTMILTFVTPMQSYILIPSVVLWGIVLVEVIIAILAPSTLFGHWKDDRYKEKLEWDSFAHFLSDLAMMKRYSPADISMWGVWLVYGTALGVGDKVEEAMKVLNISIPETGIPIGVVGMNYAFVPLMHFTPPSHAGSGGHGGFGGGGFGGGGGVGGGGAGGW